MTFKITWRLNSPKLPVPVIETFQKHMQNHQPVLFIGVQKQNDFVDFCALNKSDDVISFEHLNNYRKELRQKEKERNGNYEWGKNLFSSNHASIINKKNDLINGHTCTSSSLSSNESLHSIDNIYLHTGCCVKLPLDAYTAREVFRCCKNSKFFRKNFQGYAKANCLKTKTKSSSSAENIPEDAPTIYFRNFLILIIKGATNEHIQLPWNDRIHRLVAKKGYLEDAMSWLNTLGGGYSALGDYFSHHAMEARRVSLRQLKIALEMGDPPTVIRCHLYFGLSLMQCGYLRRAKYIIRHHYRLCKKVAPCDHRLHASCFGLWSRLGYLYKQRHLNHQRPDHQ